MNAALYKEMTMIVSAKNKANLKHQIFSQKPHFKSISKNPTKQLS